VRTELFRRPRDMTTLPSEATRFVGQSVRRKEDPRLLSGRGRYVGDVALAGMRHAAFVRSPYPCAHIRGVDTSPAAELSGVSGVFVSDDLERAGKVGAIAGVGDSPFPPLARGRVLFVGDPVAIVVAESREVAEDAAELVEVDYEPAEAVVSIDDALRDGRPIVHEGQTSNVLGEVVFDCPGIDDIFEKAAHVVTETIAQHRYVACPMETRGVVADFQPFPSKLTVWIASQGAHAARDYFANLLDLPSNDVRVIVNDVGGGFGQKIAVGREEGAVALAARLLGCPIKWIEDRWENLVAAPHAREERGAVSVAVDDEGLIQGIRADHVENVGCYGGVAGSDFAIRLIAGPYRIAASAGRTRRVRTNTSRRLAYRGPWMFETLGREVMIDITARRLGIDPLELRRRNVLRAEDLPHRLPSGTEIDRVTPRECLEQVVAMLDYETFRAEQAHQRQQGRYLGLGLSLYVEPSAIANALGATDAATIRIDHNGRVQLLTGINSQGHSVETTMAQVVADQLGVSVDDISFIRGDTDAVPVGHTTGGSRNAVFGGGAALKAGVEMRDRVARIAAEILEAAPEDVEMGQGHLWVRGTPARSVGLSEIANIAYYQPGKLPAGCPPGLEVTARFTTSGLTWSNAAHACTCEVDPVMGRVTILRYIVSEDCGTMINPKVVEGQICGGVAQGIGGVLLEHFIYDDDGNPLTTTFMDYLLPTAPEVPALEYGHIETPSQHEGGWKGMGEGGAIGSPAAVINAVNDALSPLGVELTAQPFTPVALVAAIQQAARRNPR
jgi:carbon-monoxide dehydrogenase large subunit